MDAPRHPSRAEIRIQDVFAALASPMRLEMIGILATGGEQRCGGVLTEVSKSTLTHHWRVLREGGLIRQRPVGRELLVSLRQEDLDARFPGLLDVVLTAVRDSPPASLAT
ncbi:helix-turn-helix domain-containing protein [Actinokineospora sp. NBRC 105648]|uniref:ArsR/SmtB family transcription factor n=1 Tax=Actinokineospora sp. NBRC 105648 TaxID=3032206 RepID=UPI0024A2AAFF|nr:helix-turn-helix domain-containing protein [Actinokineospora sp. NBRC 105648]GLZ36586.1 transcriptional regulator [Actinokineospora sp. NBRC 105648]